MSPAYSPPSPHWSSSSLADDQKQWSQPFLQHVAFMGLSCDDTRVDMAALLLALSWFFYLYPMVILSCCLSHISGQVSLCSRLIGHVLTSPRSARPISTRRKLILWRFRLAVVLSQGKVKFAHGLFELDEVIDVISITKAHGFSSNPSKRCK